MENILNVTTLIFKDSFTVFIDNEKVKARVTPRFGEPDIFDLDQYDLLDILIKYGMDQNKVLELTGIVADDRVFFKSKYDGFFLQ